MDPFFLSWLIVGLAIFIGGSVVAGIKNDVDIVGVSAMFAIMAPITVLLALGFVVFGAPFFITRHIAHKKEQRKLKIQQLDKELDKHIEETRKLVSL
jgi:hypothetical protein